MTILTNNVEALVGNILSVRLFQSNPINLFQA